MTDAGRGDPIRDALERAIGFQYDITRLLGRGGMGAVYHAHERALDRPVAIKVLPPDVANTVEGRERFLREARTAARLTHPNIVPLFTFGETGGLIYYVMGYVDGESLEQRLRRAGKLEANDASRILDQLASALDYAHQQGVVHRDVKPDNILIERGTGAAKLTDFGIARRAAAGETLTGTGLLLGTPRYMSPEQASGERDLDARSDVYALGLVGYAMLTGRPPFDGSSVQEILTQQVTRDAPSLRKLLPELPSQIANAVERALKKDPSLRWQTAGAMASALRDDDSEDSEGIVGTMRKPGIYALATVLDTVLVLNIAWWGGVTTTDSFFLLLVPLLLVGSGVDYCNMRWREKRSKSEIRRIYTEPPRWWPFWWPSRWRRADDVWWRLPNALRRIRLCTSAGVGIFALSAQLIFMAVTLPKGNAFQLPLLGTGGAGLPLTLLSLVGSIAAAAWWGKRNGLTYDQAQRLGSAPSGRATFWKQSWVARFLKPVGADREIAEPETPLALADAIADAVRLLPLAQRAAIGGAGEAARTLAAAIDALDAEVAILIRDADPAEVERLQSRIAALGPESPHDSPGQRDMRQLYASQLELLKRLTRQSRDLGVRRARHAELLRTLWLQLSALRAEQAADAMQVDDVSGRIRHLVQSVEREVQGVRDVGRLVGDTTPV